MSTSTKDRSAYFKQYYETNKKKCQAATAKWWKAHPEQLRAKWKRGYERNKDKRKASGALYRAKHRDKLNAGKSKWQYDNWQHRQKYMREYYAKNAERIRAKSKSLYEANKGRAWNYASKRRALIKQASSNQKIILWFVESVKSKRFAICYYCGHKISTKTIHFDHIIPLSKGGQHSIENLCVSCATCNLSKNDSLLTRWQKHSQIFLEL